MQPCLLLPLQAIQSSRLSCDAAGVRAFVMSQLHEVFQRLRWLAATRGKLRDVRRLMQIDVDTGAASSCTPLVRQVLMKILLQVRGESLGWWGGCKLPVQSDRSQLLQCHYCAVDTSVDT